MFINETSTIVKPTVKTKEAIYNIKKAATISHKAIDLAFKYCSVGVDTYFINKKIEDFILSQNATPANLEVENYGFASSISVGSEIAHSIPRKNNILNSGMPVCVDVGVNYNGYYADCARTIIVKNKVGMSSITNKEAPRLISSCKKALEYGIQKLKPNVYLSEYGRAVEKKVSEYGYYIFKSLTGHGVGYKYHESPYIFNFYHKSNDIILEPNMVFAFELMITNGSDKYITSDDGWTLKSVDNSLSAHFEYTVLITDNGAEILGI